nr:DUF2894 domain-containing protein [Luteibacter rhizovicinus]
MRPDRGSLGRLADEIVARSSSYPELAALDQFQKLWSRMRTESQLRQSLEHAPENAGPLNSSALVHRSIALMRDLSPGYLQHFVSYVDDLSSLEQLGHGAAAMPRDVPQAATIGKRPRAKARSRRE